MGDLLLLEQIVMEITQSKQQAISFKRFMELALYHPREGYYQRYETKLGKKGDFFTNAHVGSFFAKCCAHQFLVWIQEQKTKDTCALVEWGAGDGRLLKQVMQELIAQGIQPQQVDVYIIESSLFHVQQSEIMLQDSPFAVHWVKQINDIPSYPFSILYSNELVDAFPIHRLRSEPHGLTECYVTLDVAGQLVESYLPFISPEVIKAVASLDIDVSEVYEFEICMEANNWYQEIAVWMQSGYMMTIDYGGLSKNLWSHRQGTVRYFHQHQMPKMPYQQLGKVDITYDVAFDWLMKLGEQVGLQTVFYGTQRQFLLEAGILELLPSEISDDPFSVEAKEIRMIKQLIHPYAMGDKFKVLLQKK